MNITEFEFILKSVVFMAASVAFVFAAIILFNYDRFQVFNERMNARYLMREHKTALGKNYLIDNWVLEWRMGIGILIMLLATWFFWVFFR